MTKEVLEKCVENGYGLNQIGEIFDKGGTTIRYWLSKYGLKTKNIAFGKKIAKKSILMTIEKQKLQEICNECICLIDVLRYFGFLAASGNYHTLHKRIKMDSIDISHFNPNLKRSQQSRKRKLTKEDCIKMLFVKNSSTSRNIIKKYVKHYELIKYECQKCSNKGFHNSLPLTLQIDHINGVNNDPQLKNLRFLCPNCHSQTETYAGKTKEKKSNKVNNCEDCGKAILKVSKKCKKCSQGSSKIKWPNDLDLENLVWTKPLTKVALELGVSDNGVKKRCIKKNIDLPKAGFWISKEGKEILNKNK